LGRALTSEKKTSYNHKEKREARKDGAIPVSNSGRGFVKGDAKWKNYLLDYKHNSSTFTLSKNNWQKHAKDAWNENHRIPAIKVVFDDQTSLAIIPWDVLTSFEENYEQ
jgi:hypothetical protein